MILFTRRFGKYLLAVFFSVLWVQLSAQNKVVTGRVTEVSGTPVIGAVVAVKSGGSTNASITNNEGSFILRNVPQNGVLSVSFMGYVTEEYALKDEDTNAVFILRQAEEVIDDVVVVGFGIQKKESVVGAISTIHAKELITPVRSLTNTLGGRVAGIIAVQRSGEPGKDDATFWIRGINTFTGNPSPLVLVDGIERPLSNVDPLEIASFSVLKDASATAVYGVRGANGVVLITTKRGFDGPAKVDLRYEQGFSYATNRPKFLNSYDRAVLYNEAIDATPIDYSGMKYRTEELTALRTHSDLELYPDTDWQKHLMRPFTLNEKVHVNISGGGKRVKYFAAASFYNQQGQYYVNPGIYDWMSESNKLGGFGKNVNYMRYNFRSNIDMDLSNTTKVSLGIQGNVAINDEPPKGSSDIYSWIINTAPNALPLMYKDGKFPQRPSAYSPYVLLTQMGYKQTAINEVRANLTLEQDLKIITKGLALTVRYAYDAVNESAANRTRNIQTAEAMDRDPITSALNYQVMGTTEDYLNYSSTAGGNRNQYIEAALNYDRAFGKHELGALALYYMKDYRNNVNSTYMASLPYRSLGLAGRVTYAYDNRYLLEANLGWNGSENFPRGMQMGLFPAVAAGWILSNEAFLKNNRTLTFMKIRASYGQVGNDQISTSQGSRRFSYISGIDSGDGYSGFGWNFGNSAGGLREGQIGVPRITWEVSTKYDIGIELELFKKLRINGDIFYDKRKNIFLAPQVSELMGVPMGNNDIKSIWANLGTMENKGFEVTAEYSNRWGEFSLTARANYTFTRNKIIEDGQKVLYPWRDKKGTRYGERVLYDAMHLFSREEIDALPDYYVMLGQPKNKIRPGDIRYRDINDDGMINDQDMIFAGNPDTPESMFGFGASMEYKGFDFSFLFQGALGADMYLSSGAYFHPFQSERDPKFLGNVITPFINRWTEENPDPNAFAPRGYYGPHPSNYVSSTWWLRNGDYLRLKNLEFGYSLPQKVLDKLKMNRFRIYISAQNLLTMSKFANEFWDPELKANSYPLQTTIFLGLNVTF